MMVIIFRLPESTSCTEKLSLRYLTKSSHGNLFMMKSECHLSGCLNKQLLLRDLNEVQVVAISLFRERILFFQAA
ncbi:MAG: hypothetical protein IJ187_01020 [Neisseriaceae bacterium]|nr:hypothetical protein [Neisseriaceae bacterium]MBQ9724953.1 hypothetical protein [Neisseriaceae bacterium]MBR0129002.1 hypothetical protein [Neisseriaceae bacterium]